MNGLSFSSSVSSQSVQFERQTGTPKMTNRSVKLLVEMRQTESPSRLGTNGRAIKMVPASEVMKRKIPPSTNGEVEKVNGVNQVVNGANMVGKSPTSALVKAPKS